MKRFLALSLLGAVAAAGAQWFVPTGWWLNTGRGVALTCLVLALLAVAIAVPAAGPRWTGRLRRPVALWAGANIGLALVLFREGPGNIFPIVLAFGAGISAFAVGAGSLIGMLVGVGSKPWR